MSDVRMLAALAEFEEREAEKRVFDDQFISTVAMDTAINSSKLSIDADQRAIFIHYCMGAIRHGRTADQIDKIVLGTKGANLRGVM